MIKTKKIPIKTRKMPQEGKKVGFRAEKRRNGSTEENEGKIFFLSRCSQKVQALVNKGS